MRIFLAVVTWGVVVCVFFEYGGREGAGAFVEGFVAREGVVVLVAALGVVSYYLVAHRASCRKARTSDCA